ncbi:uncharacterized protein (DUF305 family) [Streptosporangium becharense]|uniref:Uncharacterized protein (DUF305 family) n=1 Tax=Streptosporangium becharense TaxID=1816182 RepID=A0A7W9IDZ6_9ACTN|nr:DUF305 domain-containing protein [Streptosporangium becharense]MBB2911979.1 uncharacterized protein (DUF305 family) [Streptosporangium becharense]MBB5818526.1 uncharacterized protein (DUF305 family) [Streptosporangium becharense]
METAVEDPPKPRRGPALGVLLGCLVLAGALLLLVVGRTTAPTDASPEAGFARDMAVHHAQAVQMSFIARDGSEDEALRTLTYDIIVTQTAQRGIFMGWLQQWGLNQSTERPPMAWMAGHGHSSPAAPGAPATMPGMASGDELGELTRAAGKDQEILFLQLMIRHHEGGVQMAQSLLKLSDREEVATMARNIVNGQAGEIALMTDMLRQRGGQPLPSIL